MTPCGESWFLFQFRSRFNSARSSSLRAPGAFLRLCSLTHAASDPSRMPTDSTTCDSGLSLDKNNLTTSGRNSSVHFDGRSFRVSVPRTVSKDSVSQEVGELHM